MKGTSTSNSNMVAKAAPKFIPQRVVDQATSSLKF